MEILSSIGLLIKKYINDYRQGRPGADAEKSPRPFLKYSLSQLRLY
jgi:hypothetical protein